MKYFEFLIFYFHKFLISIIPLRFIYLYSDLISFILRYVLRYRLNVVRQNLKNSFPGKDQKEIDAITNRFYHNLTDVMVESIKGYSMSIKGLQKRYFFRNIEVANSYFEKNQDVILALSHYCNWEWGSQIAGTVFRHSLIAFYKPIQNKFLDSYMIQNRTKRKISLVSIENPKFPLRQENAPPVAYLIISDQSPPPLTKVLWTKFLNQDTACFRGIELYAKLFKMPVIYVDVQKIKRGHYSVELEILEDNPVTASPGEITEKYMKKLESQIIKKPENWLWSHRRWKRHRFAGGRKPVSLTKNGSEIGMTSLN